MEPSSRAFIDARRGGGICIGIIPCSEAVPGRTEGRLSEQVVELPI